MGRAVLSSAALDQADQQDAKGKAVYIFHTWKDSLWDIGSSKKLDVPEPRPLVIPSENAPSQTEIATDTTSDPNISPSVAEGEAAINPNAGALDNPQGEGEAASQPKQPAPVPLSPEGEIVAFNS